MVKHSTSPTDIRTLLGDAIVDSWTQEKVTRWLEEKGWGHFTSTFESKINWFFFCFFFFLCMHILFLLKNYFRV